MDGAGGTSKNRVSRDVMSYICVIENAKAFAQYANRVVNRISSIYMLESEQFVEPEHYLGVQGFWKP